MAVILKFAGPIAFSAGHIQDSMKMFKKLNVPYDLAITNYECGLMFKDKGDKKSSKKYFKEALKLFKKLAATKEMEEVTQIIKLDPKVVFELSKEPLKTQRAVLAILKMLKSLATDIDSENDKDSL